MLCDLENLELDMANLRGQGYDGTLNVSSDHVGLQALRAPLAVYTHCS